MLLAAAALLLAGSAGIALVVGSSLRDARIQDVLPSVRPVPSPVGTPLPSGSSATPKPTRASTASPSPGLGGFVTPIPPDAETVWTGISWRKLEATDPLAYVRSVTRWRGGYVAVGDPGGDQRSGATPVWVSADGGTWSQLDSAVFGPATRVLGVGETAAGLVTLTMQGGWPPSPPLQAWTSSDGVAWTPHPGPALGPAEELPTFRAGPAGLVVAIRAGTGAGGAGQVAISRDGVAWEILSANAFPAGWRRVEAMEATPSGFIAVGSATAKTGTQTMIALSSTERVWASHDQARRLDRPSRQPPRQQIRRLHRDGRYQSPTGGGPVRRQPRSGGHRSMAAWRRCRNTRPLSPAGPDAQECLTRARTRPRRERRRMFAYRGPGSRSAGRRRQPIQQPSRSKAADRERPGGYLSRSSSCRSASCCRTRTARPVRHTGHLTR